MADSLPNIGAHVSLNKPDLQPIFDALGDAGYTLIGPTIAEGAILYDEIGHLSDLPIGWTDEQEAGTYHLEQSTTAGKQSSGTYFGYVVGPDSW